MLTTEQINLLAPDPASVVAGKQSSFANKWSVTGQSSRGIWGEISGSGALPYRTAVEGNGTAFKCSCPSRKFPCRHALGLLYLMADKPTIFTTTTEPEWVQQWLDKRQGKALSTATTPSVNPEKKAEDRSRRQEKRLNNAQNGIDELELWMCDLLREGLVRLPEKPHAFFDQAAARMVDAQLPGLAQALRDLRSIDYGSAANWQSIALEQLTRMWLLVRGLTQMSQLPADWVQDMHALAGIGPGPKDVLESPETLRVSDKWLVIARRQNIVEDITHQWNWVYGCESGRFALILQFAYKLQPMEWNLLPGKTYKTTLAFFPSTRPLRAVIQDVLESVPNPNLLPTGYASLQDLQKNTAKTLQSYPWKAGIAPIGRNQGIPVLVHHVIPVLKDDRWWLMDQNGAQIQLAMPAEIRYFQLLALSGGDQVDVFGLLDADRLDPLAVWLAGKLHVLAFSNKNNLLKAPIQVANTPPLWSGLVQSALLGTDRITWSAATLPPLLKARLEHESDNTEPSYLFNAAALILGYLAARTTFPIAERLPMDMPKVETKIFCSEEFASIWLKIKYLDNKYWYLEQLWMERCIELGQVARPEILVSILESGGKKASDLWPLIRVVVGERGRWLAHAYAPWQYVIEETLEKKTTKPLIPPSVFEQMSALEKEDFVQKCTEQERSALWSMEAIRFGWSLAFSNWVLRHLYESWAGYYFHKVQYIMPLDVFLHPDVRPDEVPGIVDDPTRRDRWLEMIAPELNKILEIKRLLRTIQ